jgi:hypothetical protein
VPVLESIGASHGHLPYRFQSVGVLSPEPGTGARSVESEPGFLSKDWLRFEALFGCACVPAVGCGERPSLEGLQEVTVVTEKGQVAGKPCIEPRASPPPGAPIGVGLGDAGSWHDAV